MPVPGPPPTQEQLVAQLVAVLAKIPPADRGRFARTHLAKKHPRIVEAFDGIPASQAEHTILFVSLRPQHAREPKLAAAARLAGWEPMMLYAGRANYDPGTLFSFHYPLADEVDIVLAGWLFPGSLIHLFTDTGAAAHLFCQTKHRKVILDIFDTNSGMKWFPPEHAQLERAAIANADGVAHRDLRVQYLHKLHGYVLPAHNVFLIDPLTEDHPRPVCTESSDGEIRVVSAGWIGDDDTSILMTVQALCAARIHVHMYPYPPGSSLTPYRRLARLSDYFHLETPVFGAEFGEHLSRYDFGLCPCERFIFGEESTRYTADYFRGCGSARVMDYIQAGLGIIGSPEIRFQHFCARRYASSLVRADLAFLRDPRPILEAARRNKRPLATREFTSIGIPAVSQRLGRFYSAVATGHNAGATLPARTRSTVRPVPAGFVTAA